MTHAEILEFYRRPGPMTSTGQHADVLQALPDSIEDLATVLHGLLLHEHWAPAYGQTLSDARRDQAHTRPATGLLDLALANDAQPLTVARPLDARVVGNCRSYSVLMVAFLRSKGIPARARCGFGAYFNPGTFEDHWVCEYWNDGQARWVLADAQIDAFQRERLQIDFDVLDVPRDQFVVAGDAWHMCQSGQADPEAFGIADMRGLWFVGGNVMRDLAALNNMELLPWDDWGATPDPEVGVTEAQHELSSLASRLTSAPDDNFDGLRALYNDELVRVPGCVTNALRNQIEQL